ncbi:MAG: PLP-dependent aminotransferase family protein [Pseudomonadota bacterium]
MSFDHAPYLPPGTPEPGRPWTAFPKFNFVGGHIDGATVPVAQMRAAMDRALARDGHDLATYYMQSGPQGYRPCREVVADKLVRYSGFPNASADDILLTSGSLQAMDLVNRLFLAPGDTVLVEASNYGGTFSKLRALNVTMVPVAVDDGGMRMDALETSLRDLAARGVRPKYIFTIATVHNPTGTIMPLDRRHRLLSLAQAHRVPIFEDECYSDLVWANARPPALAALDDSGLVVHIGTFSKTVGPALRVGYIHAAWPVLGRLIALKTDAGSPALEQMMLAEFCPDHFDSHLRRCNSVLEGKLDALIEALDAEFGTTVSYTRPPGGIFLWVKLPDGVSARALAKAAGSVGVAVNPGPDWALTDDADGWVRLCFANPPAHTIRAGVARLAEVCHREFGTPTHGANRTR